MPEYSKICMLAQKNKYGEITANFKEVLKYIQLSAEKALYFKISADKGQILCIAQYADIFYNGDGIPINKKEAAKYYKLAADKKEIEGILIYSMPASLRGCIPAMKFYAIMLFNGDGTDTDIIEDNFNTFSKYFKMADDKKEIEDIFNTFSSFIKVNEIFDNNIKTNLEENQI